MVAFSRNQQGKGIVDSLLSPFTVEKYHGEKHARSLDPEHFLQGYNFVGPSSRLDIRLNPDETPKTDSMPLNSLDRAAYKHDLAYKHELDGFKKDHNKAKHIKNVWNADREFINESKNQTDDTIIGNLSSKLIETKMNLEENGLLPTETFEGFGENVDPTFRLKQLVQKELKHENKKVKHARNQKEGGLAIAPLIPILAPFLAPIAGEIVKDIYTFVKGKIRGSGIKTNHIKTHQDKKQFLINLLSQI